MINKWYICLFHKWLMYDFLHLSRITLQFPAIGPLSLKNTLQMTHNKGIRLYLNAGCLQMYHILPEPILFLISSRISSSIPPGVHPVHSKLQWLPVLKVVFILIATHLVQCKVDPLVDESGAHGDDCYGHTVSAS